MIFNLTRATLQLRGYIYNTCSARSLRKMYNEVFNVGERRSRNLIIPTTGKFIVYYYRGRDGSRRIEQGGEGEIEK